MKGDFDDFIVTLNSINKYIHLFVFLFECLKILKYCRYVVFLQKLLRICQHGVTGRVFVLKLRILQLLLHTIYIRNNMGQKCEGNCGLWVLNETIKKIYLENLKKIVGAV